jgi:hypothetical protein
MKFILKEGHIHIVNNSGLANNSIEASIVKDYVKDFEKKQFEYSINGGKFKKLGEKLIIGVNELKKAHIDLVITATGSEGIERFTVDRLPLTYAVVFGESIDNAYPEKIHQLEAKIDETRTLIGKVLDYVEEIEKKGRLL